MKFTKQFLQDLLRYEEGGAEIIEDVIAETGRWSVYHDLVFKYRDKYYSVTYSVGATEQQAERPFEYDGDEIECKEVVPIEVPTIIYVPKKGIME